MARERLVHDGVSGELVLVDHGGDAAVIGPFLGVGPRTRCWSGNAVPAAKASTANMRTAVFQICVTDRWLMSAVVA